MFLTHALLHRDSCTQHTFTQRCFHTEMAHTEALSHLLRTVLSNFDVECVLRAKTRQLSLTGKGQWHDPRNCDMFPVNRLRKPYRHWNDMEWKPENLVWFDTVWKTKRQGGSWVSLATSNFGKIDMKIEAGTSRWSAVISACTVAASLDHRTQYMDGPPALEIGAQRWKS